MAIFGHATADLRSTVVESLRAAGAYESAPQDAARRTVLARFAHGAAGRRHGAGEDDRESTRRLSGSRRTVHA